MWCFSFFRQDKKTPYWNHPIWRHKYFLYLLATAEIKPLNIRRIYQQSSSTNMIRLDRLKVQRLRNRRVIIQR